jgi:hypothetical protein
VAGTYPLATGEPLGVGSVAFEGLLAVIARSRTALFSRVGFHKCVSSLLPQIAPVITLKEAGPVIGSGSVPALLYKVTGTLTSASFS